ncbi:MAG: luciferase family protein, partial [Solirubrobacterales bacterium]
MTAKQHPPLTSSSLELIAWRFHSTRGGPVFEETRTPSEQITQTVTAWDGVEAGYGKRGEYGFRISGHEVGHLHGDHAAHFSFG